MKILNIENRTENWKTVKHFYRLSKAAKERLAKQLLANHCRTTPSQVNLGSGDVHIELFWKGIRDYLDTRGGKKTSDDEDFGERYKCLFVDKLNLRAKIKESRLSQKPAVRALKPSNYVVTEVNTAKLGDNLYGTEIDIVLQTPDYLFIGEAKGESSLRGKSQYVLVHQLIRQYVMARILVNRLVSEKRITPKKVIPFVVRNNPKGREQAEVKLMQYLGWMRKENVLAWEDIKQIACAP